MDLDTEILLNQFAQGVHSRAAAIEWFSRQHAPRKAEILRRLAYLTQQAQVVGRHVSPAIEWAGLKPSPTPCVLLLKAEERDRLGSRAVRAGITKILALPQAEGLKTFLLLLGLLSVADGERRSSEERRCSRHWWHQDLADPAVVEAIRVERRRG